MSATGNRHPDTITALGNVQVDNSGYSGPSASVAPFNLKKVQRHYGFGTTKGTVMIGTYTVPAANITTWTDTTIILTIPATATIPACKSNSRPNTPGARGGAVRSISNHNRQHSHCWLALERQAIDRYRDGDDWRQGPRARGPLADDSELHRRG